MPQYDLPGSLMWSAAWLLGSLGKHVWLAVCVDAANVVCIVCQSMLWLIYVTAGRHVHCAWAPSIILPQFVFVRVSDVQGIDPKVIRPQHTSNLGGQALSSNLSSVCIVLYGQGLRLDLQTCTLCEPAFGYQNLSGLACPCKPDGTVLLAGQADMHRIVDTVAKFAADQAHKAACCMVCWISRYGFLVSF